MPPSPTRMPRTRPRSPRASSSGSDRRTRRGKADSRNPEAMYLTIVTLTPPSPTAAMLSRTELLRIVLDAASPGDALEHLSIQIVPGRVFLGLFTTCGAADERVRRARGLCLRA